MYKKHAPYSTAEFVIIPPTGILALTNSHKDEAVLLNKDLVDYYTEIKTYPSAKLTVYSNFISYTLNESDAHKHMLKLNRAYRKLK